MNAPRAPEKERDQAVTGFSGHLDNLIRQLPEALCAVFIDGEGETIDLASRLDLFDARVTGAEMAVLLASVRQSFLKLSQGETLEFRLEGSERSIIARHVSEGYDLIVLIQAATISARAAELTAAAAISLLVEAGLKPPPSYAVLRAVEQRPSRTGLLVPTAFEEGGVRRRVESILGHRADTGEAKFLVRLDDGEELVLEQENSTGKWRRG
jgi:predicted regulator of Ras-like GTPase activity (Roadblock/LC7/MglB family)